MRRETRDSIFSPNIEIPRTPTNSIINTNNTNTNNTNTLPYTLNLFTR